MVVSLRQGHKVSQLRHNARFKQLCERARDRSPGRTLLTRCEEGVHGRGKIIAYQVKQAHEVGRRFRARWPSPGHDGGTRTVADNPSTFHAARCMG